MKAKSAAIGIASLVALAIGTATSAAASTAHTTEDVTGQVFACTSHTYTLTGQIDLVVHSITDAQGGEHSTLTATTTGVTALDEEGTPYRIVGTQWLGSNDTPDGGVATFTFHLQMIARGAGSVDTVSLSVHVGPNGETDHDNSTCVS
jgi:hypothetical protein